jgi:hypothetical protein
LGFGFSTERTVTFERCQSEGPFSQTFWQQHPTATMRRTTVEQFKLNKRYKLIEDVCDEHEGRCWEVDFANERVGGGVIGRGCVQEEIRFLQCPELIVCKLFMHDLGPNESVKISNYRQFNVTEGYRDNFKWVSIKMSEEPKDPRRMIVMDALSYIPNYNQFMISLVNREIHKAHVGFSTGDQLPISTGHWGCGAFHGDRQLKAVIQMLAAGMAGKDLHYCVMGDNYTEIQRLADAVRGKNVRDVYTLLANYISRVSPLQNFANQRVIDKLFVDFCAECATLETPVLGT